MATFTLSELRDEVSKKYAPTVVKNGNKTYTLQNLLQLPTKQREAVLAKVDGLDNLEDKSLDAQLEIFREIILDVEENGKGQELIDLLGENPAMLLELMTTWMDGTQLGEAER